MISAFGRERGESGSPFECFANHPRFQRPPEGDVIRSEESAGPGRPDAATKTRAARRRWLSGASKGCSAALAAFAPANSESPTLADTNLKILPLVIYYLESFQFDLVEFVVGRRAGFVDQPVLIFEILENALDDIRKGAF